MSIDEWILLVALVVIALGVLGVGFRRAIKDVETTEVSAWGLVLGRPGRVRCSRCGSDCFCVGHYAKDGERYTDWQCKRCMKQ